MSTTTAVTTPATSTTTQPTTGKGESNIKFSITSILNIDSEDVSLLTGNYLFNNERFIDQGHGGEDLYDLNEVLVDAVIDEAPESVLNELHALVAMCKTHHCAYFRMLY